MLSSLTFWHGSTYLKCSETWVEDGRGGRGGGVGGPKLTKH